MGDTAFMDAKITSYIHPDGDSTSEYAWPDTLPGAV